MTSPKPVEWAKVEGAIEYLRVRSALLDRAVEALRDARALMNVFLPGVRSETLAVWDEILTSYASLPKMPEQGKQKGESSEI